MTADAIDATTYRGEPRPPCRLVGEDGNAYAIMGRVVTALRRARCSDEHIKAYTAEAMAGDYDNLLRVSDAFVIDTGEDEPEDDTMDTMVSHVRGFIALDEMIGEPWS